MLNRIHHGWMRPVHQGARASRHRSQSLGMTVQLDLGGEEVVGRSARGHRQDVAPPERRGRPNCGQSLGLYRRCRWGQGSWPTFSVALCPEDEGFGTRESSPFPVSQRDGGRALRPYPRVLGADSKEAAMTHAPTVEFGQVFVVRETKLALLCRIGYGPTG